MKIRTLAAIAGLLLGATGCTAQEIAFWTAWHAEHPDEATAFLQDGRAPERADPSPLVRLPHDDHPDHDISLDCPTLTVSNTSAKPEALAIHYGPTQAPLGPLSTDLPGGSTTVIDLSVAVGQQVVIFLDNGAVARIDALAC